MRGTLPTKSSTSHELERSSEGCELSRGTQSGHDTHHPSRRSVLPFPARLRASHVKLKLKPPSPPVLPYTAPSVIDSGGGDAMRARPAPDYDHAAVDIPAYRLTLDELFGSDERGGDDAGGGGKKRKVPASAVTGPFDQEADTPTHSPAATAAPVPFVTRHHRPSIIARSHIFHRLLLARRKSQILTLQSDAADQLKKSSPKNNSSAAAPLITDLMKSEGLDLLWQSLDTISAGKWPWDRMAWRGKAIIDDPNIMMTKTGVNAVPPEPKKPVVGRWKSPIWRRRLSLRSPRSEIRRSGWIPEGSFEVEIGSNISKLRRKNQELLDQLRAYVQELLTVSLLPAPKRATAARKKSVKQAVSTPPAPAVKATSADPEQTASSPVKSSASDATELDNGSNDGGSGGGKTKKKGKKKRSVLANNSNPHHVKNYVPSRTAAPTALPDPAMSSVLSSLLLPMPNRFLAARPIGSSPEGPAKVGSDEFICASCEYSLFFGSRESMLRALAKRKRELRRRERVLRRARGVTEGRKPGTSGLYHGEDEDDEDWCDEECRGCTCGGAARNRDARERARKGRIKDDVH